MSIPPDFSPDDDPVLSDERLTPDDPDPESLKLVPDLLVPLGDPRRPPLVGRPTTKAQKSGELSFGKQTMDMQGQGEGKLAQAQMGIGIETALTREEVMGPRPTPQPAGMHPGGRAYSDLSKRGASLNIKAPQKREVYGARTQAELQASIEKTRFRGNAPPNWRDGYRGSQLSAYLERPTARKRETTPDSPKVGRPPDDRTVEPTTKAERLRMAADSPRYAHQDITDDDMWRDLMEESPARTAGTRSSFDSLLSPRGGRAASRAQTDPVLDNVPENRLDRAFGRRRLWPGSVDPNTPDLPPPPAVRGRPRKQL